MKRFLVMAILAVAATACADRILLPVSENVDVEGESGITHEMIVLGDRLEDPFTVENMTKAVESLYPSKAGRIVLEATDIYVRFLPKDRSEYDLLESLFPNLMDHPVDYEIVQEGDYYRDPQIAEDELTWQYAVVPAGFEFPEGINYEIIDECYISSGVTKDGIDWDAVERESYRLTGNEALLASPTKAGYNGPHGRITLLDPERSEEPEGVKGVLVNCNSFVKFCSAYTDEDGYYEMDKSYSSAPRFRLVFKNVKGFAIGFNLVLLPASISTLGRCSSEGVSVDVTPESDRRQFCRCVVNNAGYEYYCSCEGSNSKMTAPPSNLRIWLLYGLEASSAVMLQQGALIDGSLLDQFLGEFCSLVKMFLPDITLGMNGKDTYRQIYNATVHEFAHASHFMQVGTDFWNAYIKFIVKSFVTSGFVTYGTGTEENHGYCEVGEMWAYYVQTVMHRERYSDNEAVFGTSYWFSPQIFLYLDERGLSRYNIFAALTKDIVDKEILQDKLLSLYPSFKATINQGFGRYN